MTTANFCLKNYVDLSILENLIDSCYLKLMEKFVPEKKLVYTSFDGDFMHYLYFMQEYAMSRGFVPINPEAALGYYVSTTSHSGNKVPVMMDCIRTELICDYMWIFNPCSGHVSEGVLAELMAWNIEKNTEVSIIEFFPSEINHIDTTCIFPMHRFGAEDINDFVKGRSNIEIDEINTKLLEPYKKQVLQNAYIIANFHNYKHIDWARKFCYMNQLSPVCAQTLLPYHLYAKPEYGNEKYLYDRLNLLSRTDNILLFINTKRIEEEIYKLDKFSLCEIYYVLKYRNDMEIDIIGWNDASVPKYSSDRAWALTTIESLEV